MAKARTSKRAVKDEVRVIGIRVGEDGHKATLQCLLRNAARRCNRSVSRRSICC